jgi:solute carrier family 25 phosphate transporter 3
MTPASSHEHRRKNGFRTLLNNFIDGIMSESNTCHPSTLQYNRGLIGGFKQIIAEEGAMALTTGLGATAAGYFIQGWFKFGGVEYFKINAAQSLGEEKAWENKTIIYIGAAAAAECIADIFLCPLEAVRIRSVSDPEFCDGLIDGFKKMAAQEGIGGFYAGLVPILAKQVPYTCAKFVVQGNAADAIYASMGKTPADVPKSTNIGISLASGVVAGVASAIISHPADTLLSKVNKKGAGGSGSMASRLANIAKEIGFVKLCTVGLAPRCVMIGTLTAGQFGIFDTVMNALGASKFHFHNPHA